MKTLLLTHPLPAKVFADAVHAIEPTLPLLEYQPGLTDAELAEVEAVLGWRFPAGVAERLPRLRWVCSVGAGVEKLLVPRAAGAGARVAHRRCRAGRRHRAVRGADGAAPCTQPVALRIAAAQHVSGPASRSARCACHVGVLGMGAMGSAVARMLQAVGFQVTGYSRHSGQSLQSVLGGSDIVVCALPLTPQTRGLLERQGAGANAAWKLPDEHRAWRACGRG